MKQVTKEAIKLGVALGLDACAGAVIKDVATNVLRPQNPKQKLMMLVGVGVITWVVSDGVTTAIDEICELGANVAYTIKQRKELAEPEVIEEATEEKGE